MNRKNLKCLLLSCTLAACLLLNGCGTDSETSTNTAPVAENTASEPPANSSKTENEATDASNTESEASTTTDSATENTPSTETDSNVENEPSSNDSASNTKQLTISVFNMCGADFGMFSVIDPATNEQINLNAVGHEESLSFEAAWPIEITEFQWAIYNQNGELYMEGKTDITAANTDVALLFTGDGAVDSVEEKFK